VGTLEVFLSPLHSAEGIAEGDVVSAAPTLVGHVNPDIEEKQIQQPVVVEVEENGAGRVP
jgi:hypothetical protein